MGKDRDKRLWRRPWTWEEIEVAKRNGAVIEFCGERVFSKNGFWYYFYGWPSDGPLPFTAKCRRLVNWRYRLKGDK